MRPASIRVRAAYLYKWLVVLDYGEGFVEVMEQAPPQLIRL
jgi:hypothetical protein